MHQKFHLGMILILFFSGCTNSTPLPATVSPTRQATVTVTAAPESTSTSIPVPVEAEVTQVVEESPSPDPIEQISISNVEGLRLIAEYRDETHCVEPEIPSNTKILFCSDGVFLQEAGEETRIGTEDLRPYYPFRLPYVDDQSRRVATSADAQILGLITDQLRIVAIDRSGRVLANLDPPMGDPEMVFISLSPDGRYLAVESDYVDQFLMLFDIQKQEYVNLPQYNARQIKFSQDSQYLYFYEQEKSWESAKLKVLSIPDWQKIDQSAAMTEFPAIEDAFENYPTLHQIKSDPGEYLGGFFKLTQEKDGLWVNYSAIQVGPGTIDGTLYFGDRIFCRYLVNSDKKCQFYSESMIDRSDVFVSGTNIYTAVTSVAKTTGAGNPLEGITTIYGGDPAENLILDTLPDFARIYQFSPKYHLAFYQPFGFDEVFNVYGTKRSAAYYNLASQKILISFETAGKEEVAGYISDSYPYAITILNNSIGQNDQFNVYPLDGGHESTAGWLNNTTENTRPVFAMSPDQRFFAVVSTKPQTKKDGIISDHLVLNVLYLNNLDVQEYFELPGLMRPAIVEYNLDRHSQEYEPAAMDMEISPDGKMAVIGMSTGMVYFVDLATGVIVHELQAHAAGIQALTFSPDGSELFTLDQVGNLSSYGISD